MKDKFNLGDQIMRAGGSPTMEIIQILPDGSFRCSWIEKNKGYELIFWQKEIVKAECYPVFTLSKDANKLIV